MRKKYSRRWFDRLLKRQPQLEFPLEEVVGGWHFLNSYLQLVVNRPCTSARELAGVAQVAIGVANLALLALSLARDPAKARKMIQATTIDGPGANLVSVAITLKAFST